MSSQAIISEHDAEGYYQKAAHAELSKDYNKAFRLYINATEGYLLLSRQSTNDRLRANFKAQAAKALERAEKIRAVKQEIKPANTDQFSEGHQLYVLQKGSLVNGGFYPLWESPEATASSQQPPLSLEQIKHGATWRTQAQQSSPQELEPEDIVQHIVSDCSVCASMVVAIDHRRRFGSKMVFSSLYPQDQDGMPGPSGTGEYQFKVFYNGAYRRIAIDEMLPAYPDGTLMCVSTGEKGQTWPSLVEKAYMTLAGGYDFIGSDSGTDLHALACWIPETIDLRGPHLQREKTWNRLAHGYTSGQCVATLGTAEHLDATDASLALLPTHCYAIIGVHDTDETRGVTIFDPWVQPAERDRQAESDMSPSQTKPRERAIQLSMDTVFQSFSGIYFSWDPAMFKHKMTFHGMWKRGGSVGNSSTHLRVEVKLDNASVPRQDDELWVLLTRHVRSHRAKDEFIALTTQCGGGSGVDVLSTKGEYTNSSHILVKTPINQTEDTVSILASYEGDRADVGFTLTVYSNHPASWSNSSQKLLYIKDIEGAFTQKTAGGNHTYPTYYLNPQYHVRVHPRSTGPSASARDVRDAKATVSVAISTDRHIPVHGMLAWSQGGRINELGHNDLALSSGPYSYGYAHARGRVPPGDYTLVVSAFEPRHLGKFDLRVECSDRVEVTPILQEGAGMFSKLVRGEWTPDTAGGGPSSGRYSSNPTYELQIPSACQLRFRLQLSEPSPSVALNLTVFNTSTGSSLGRHVATSGPYSDAIAGVIIEKLMLQPGKYLVVPSTYKPGVLAGFRLIMYTSISGVQLTPRR